MARFIDLLHKGTVLGCVGMTVYGGGFIVVRIRDIQRKSKELDEYAKDERLTYSEAASRVKPCQLGHGFVLHPPYHTLVACRWSDPDLQSRTELLLGRMQSQEIKCCAFPHAGSAPSALDVRSQSCGSDERTSARA